MARKKKAETQAAPAAETEVAEATTGEQAPTADDADLSQTAEFSADDAEAFVADIESDADNELPEVDATAAPAAEAAPTDQPGTETAAGEAAAAEAAPAEQAPAEGAPVGEGEAPAAVAEPAAVPAAEQTPADGTAPAAAPAEPAPAAPAEPVQTEEERQAAYIAWRDTTEASLATGVFALSEEQAQELEDSPATAMPKLAARVMLQAVEGASRAVMSYLPQLVQQTNQVETARREAGTAFFKEWPQLQTEAAKTALKSIGTSYRQTNPNASVAEFIRDVGAMTMVAMKFPQGTPAAGNGAAAPAVPAAPMAAIAPHVPVGGGAPAPAAPGAPPNVFSELAEEILSDEG